MGKGRDLRVIFLASSLLCLITWHIVTNFITFRPDDSPAIQVPGGETLAIDVVAPKELISLDFEDSSNAPFTYSKLQLNSASAELFETIPGIGSSLAGRIVEFRNSYGDFTSYNSLTEVSGVGPGKMKILKQYTRL